MPILSRHLLPDFDCQYGIWAIAEPEAYFVDALPWETHDLSEIRHIHGHRRTESLAARLLLHQLTGSSEPWPVQKDAHSKPQFPEHLDWYCSLSHSHGMAASMLAKRACGIDLQRFTEKMPALAQKFVNSDEAAWINTQATEHQNKLYHMVWTAKEAMYKVYGRKQLDFKVNLHVNSLTPETITSQGHIEKQHEYLAVHLHFQWLNDLNQHLYCLCVALSID
jgi:4'-phosphopantetheinyl transferase